MKIDCRLPMLARLLAAPLASARRCCMSRTTKGRWRRSAFGDHPEPSQELHRVLLIPRVQGIDVGAPLSSILLQFRAHPRGVRIAGDQAMSLRRRCCRPSGR